MTRHWQHRGTSLGDRPCPKAELAAHSLTPTPRTPRASRRPEPDAPCPLRVPSARGIREPAVASCPPVRGGRRGRSAPQGRRPPPAGCGTEQTPRRRPRPELHGRAPACSAPTPMRGQVLRGRPCPRAGATGGCSVGGRVCVGEGASLGRTLPSVLGSSALNKGPSPAGHRLKASCPRGYCHLRASRTESPARSHSPRSPAPAGHVVRHLRPSGGPGVGHQEVSRRPEEGTGNRRGLRGDLQRRRRRSHGSDAGRRCGEETRGGDAAISVPGSGSPQRAKATERAQAGTPGRHPGTSPARSDADFTRPRPPPRTSCAGGRLRAGGPRP